MAMQPWFTDAKLGIVVLEGIMGARYDPRAWAPLFARAGARYAVLTSRHQEGVALWDTAYGDSTSELVHVTGSAAGIGSCEGFRSPAAHLIACPFQAV